MYDETDEVEENNTDDGTTATVAEMDSPVSEALDAVAALNELATSSDFSVQSDSTNKYMSDALGLSPDSNLAIESRIKSFQAEQSETMGVYLQESDMPTATTTDFLYILNGWNYGKWGAPADRSKFFLPESYRATSGGYFLRWNDKGIVINPGENFLQNLHTRGLNVRDIDYVLVTSNAVHDYSEVQAIYDLNYQFNLKTPNLHIINYYLNQGTHRELTSCLKPNFKQERNTVHCLELYVDSPDVESVELCSGINLNYFPTSTHEGSSDTAPSCLGLQLHLQRGNTGRSQAREEIKVGYVSGTAWSPSLVHNLTGCDLLIAGFENTCSDDYNKMRYNSDCLGYFGTHSLMEQVAPKLLLCCEFGGREGDIRMEVVKKMRQEHAYGTKQQTVILPGDTGLCMDLQHQLICCEVSGQLVDPTQVRVTKASEAFGPLSYLAPSCVV